MGKYTILIGFLLLIYSCGKKDKFECDMQNQMAPADDSSVLYMPTAFSPNGDGLNDFYGPVARNIDSVHFEIYDLENNQVFISDALGGSWRPSLTISSGIQMFHYKLTAKSSQGYTYQRCGDFYAYRCLPKDFDASVLIFADQYDPSMPDGSLKVSLENLSYCQ